MDNKQIQERHHFITAVLKELQLAIDDFMYQLFHDNPGAILIYVWIDRLYQENKSVEESLKVITRALCVYVMHKEQRNLCRHPQSLIDTM